MVKHEKETKCRENRSMGEDNRQPKGQKLEISGLYLGIKNNHLRGRLMTHKRDNYGIRLRFSEVYFRVRSEKENDKMRSRTEQPPNPKKNTNTTGNLLSISNI